MQLGVGLVRVSQLTVAAFALAQTEVAWWLAARIDLHVQDGGPRVGRLADLLGLR
jgi:hypothetical protein